MIKLSKRLQLVASFVDLNANLIDVGCDHAYLPIYLCQKFKNITVYASDINKNPLNIAIENIKKYGLENRIKTILMDGIKGLEKNIDTVIISGMGGILISDILNDKRNLKYVKTLIISPNNEFETLRKTIKKIGFKIIKERLITENKITYLVIKAIPGKKKTDPLFGILNNKDLESIYYFTKRLNTNTSILKKLPKKYLKRRIKLIIENKKIKKFLENPS